MNDLLFTQGDDNLAGVIDYLWVCAQADIDPALLPTLAAAGSLVVNGNITLLAGKKFGRVYFTDQTAKVDIKSVGEIDGKSLEVMISGRYPKLDTGFINFLREIQNGPLVVIYRMANNGKKFLMGFSNLDKATNVLTPWPPVYFDGVDATSGAKRGDQNGGQLSFKWSASHGPIEYNGTIDIT